MTTWLPTRPTDEDGPIQGYVYLAIRNKTDYSVKIGSTRLLPTQRLYGTPSCDNEQFLIACHTDAARELEHKLHINFTKRGRKLQGRDSFNLSLEEILALAMWFNGGIYQPDPDAESHTLTLVDSHGNPPETAYEFGKLLGRVARLAIAADYIRRMNAECV